MKKYTIRRAVTGPHLVEPTRFQIDYRNELNASQYEAVTSVNGPHLVIAGAGTGKTRTIVFRVSYLVEMGVRPEKILLLTFTRKAAQEMIRRASILLDNRCEKVSGGTFHSFANSTLRKYAPLIGYESNFTILDQSDAEDVVNLLRTRQKLDTKQRRFPRKETLYDLFSRSVNTITTVESLLASDYPHYMELLDEILNLQRTFAAYKRDHNLMDYDDLLTNLFILLRDQPAVCATLSDRYTYIMVDEYQDTNRVQAEIVKLLSARHRNIMVVGDDAQSIYSFRGATIRNILEFPENFTDCKTVTLEENYRSTQAILNVANAILRQGTNPE